MLKRSQLEALGRRLQDLRKEKRLTQSDLAERSNLTPNYIGKIERGEAQPTLEALLAITDGLKANPSTLFTALDRPPTRDEAKRRIRESLELL